MMRNDFPVAEAKIDKRLFNRKLIRLSLPIALQNLMLSLVAAADALMLGRVAQVEMTAVSLATQIQFVQNMILFAITNAASILGAQYFGKGDRDTIRDIFNITLETAFSVSLLSFLACEFIPEQLMKIFTADEEFAISEIRASLRSYVVECITAFMTGAMNVDADWDNYLAPAVNRMLSGHGHTFMLAVGVIEILAGIGVHHPQNTLGVSPLFLYRDKKHGKVFPDFYSQELILDAKYKYATIQREDRFQLISYIHIQNARAGYLIFPGNGPTQTHYEDGQQGLLNGGGALGYITFAIPAEAFDFSDFCQQIRQSEITLQEIVTTQEQAEISMIHEELS